MTVQELFKKIDEKEFVDTYLRNDRETQDLFFNTALTPEQVFERFKHYKEIILKTFNQFKIMPIEKDQDYIMFVIPRFEGDNCGHSFVCFKKELLNNENEDIEHFAYYLSPHKNILSYDISETCLSLIDEITIAVSIFSEMTFFGFSTEEHNKKIKDIKTSVTDIAEKIDNGTANTHSFDGILNQIGIDERTKEEKEFSLSLAMLEGQNYNLILNKYFEIEKYYLKKERKNKDDEI